ncbi:uncharacterized protein BDZ83DRAFT_5640 [Colletotrichum acutatum]|uniref:Uncharacterized protein n=1 Tax=Glomerella acutata TaxID=27357 RepID=A0AAD8XQR7_GLOAC|nr:uncharacterized protein BDZ83DRAFT_5640 [Colletotrichum acutatum]KAK1731809.1 hypothetical protein BDZ83DRAFT_5640 [Colletotrichum acutatum]
MTLKYKSRKTWISPIRLPRQASPQIPCLPKILIVMAGHTERRSNRGSSNGGTAGKKIPPLESLLRTSPEPGRGREGRASNSLRATSPSLGRPIAAKPPPLHLKCLSVVSTTDTTVANLSAEFPSSPLLLYLEYHCIRTSPQSCSPFHSILSSSPGPSGCISIHSSPFFASLPAISPRSGSDPGTDKQQVHTDHIPDFDEIHRGFSGEGVDTHTAPPAYLGPNASLLVMPLERDKD